ncbi:MAG: hypothetical protein P8Y48_03750 [Novosphingobium sp.]
MSDGQDTTGAGGVFRRFRAGASAQLVLRAVVMLQTAALIPVMLSKWGLEVYGAWVAITALASYVGMSNFGLTNASAVEMMLASGAGEIERARRVLLSTVAFLGLLTIPVVLLVSAAVLFAPLRDWLNLTQTSTKEANIMLICVVAQVWQMTIRGVYAGAIAATGRFGASNIIQATVRLLEFLTLVIEIYWFNAGIALAAATLAVTAALDLLIHIICTARYVPWSRPWSFSLHRRTLSALIQPSLGNLTIQIGLGIVLVQGPRVILSVLLGPAAVALFAVHSTAARLIQQVASIVISPLNMEMSLSIGREDRNATTRLIATGTQVVTIMALGALLALAVTGPWLLPWWTRGTVSFMPGLFAALALMMLLNSFSSVMYGAVTGTNRILIPALLMLTSGIIGIAFGGLASLRWGVAAMGMGAALGELMILLVCLFSLRIFLNLHPLKLLGQILDVRTLGQQVEKALSHFAFFTRTPQQSPGRQREEVMAAPTLYKGQADPAEGARLPDG